MLSVSGMLRAATLASQRAAPHARALTTGSTRIPIYQLDSFASAPFKGNPAAVCQLEAWLPDETLTAIAAENNLSETAFFVAEPGGSYHLRWFTPTLEVDCCGHATLATGALILDRIEPEASEVSFSTLSGELKVRRSAEDKGSLSLDFPQWPAGEQCAAPASLVEAMGAKPEDCWPIPPLHGAPYFLFLYDDESTIANLAPDLKAMEANVVATARSERDGIDFVSRWFGPCSGIDEDPATGSAHMTLAPFWASRLGKSRMEARQLSSRGGELSVELAGEERVTISGKAVFYMEGAIYV